MLYINAGVEGGGSATFADDQLAGNPMAAVRRPRLAPRAPKPLLGWDKVTVERLVDFVMSAPGGWCGPSSTRS